MAYMKAFKHFVTEIACRLGREGALLSLSVESRLGMEYTRKKLTRESARATLPPPDTSPPGFNFVLEAFKGNASGTFSLGTGDTTLAASSTMAEEAIYTKA